MAFSIESSPSSIGAGDPLARASSHRVLIVSNRLPTTVHLHGDFVRLSPSSGGLATGLRSIHTSSSGLWIGWSGASDSLSASVRGDIDTCLAQIGACAVPLTEADVEGFYRGFANGVLWPLLHDGTPATTTSWDTYRRVNARFAEVVLRHWRPGDRIWIHDYHLMLLPRMLRERRPDARIGFFLHTPFPTTETLAALPDAPALIEGMLGADAIGFQTRADVDRFGEAVRALLGRWVRLASGTGVTDDLGRPVRLHFSPMSVDVAGFAARAADPRIDTHLAALRAPGTPLFVGVDRLDPTKGIPERLEAFGRLLELRPELRGRARLLQLAVPSREDLPAYRALRERIELNVAALNARYGLKSWKPVELMYRQVDELELAALYRAADVMLVTPLRDGMNLVAKEFVASRVDGQGVLVLSRSAGAAAELTAALLVDLSDVGTLVSAYDRALDMSPAERRVRMTRLRASVRAHDIGSWAGECLQQLEQAGSAPGGIGRWAPRGRRHV